jgi:Ca-activated chloride channel homolog
MRFGHPQILTLLLVVGLALAGFLVWAWRKRQRLITHFVQDRLLAQLTVGVSRPRQKLQMVLAGLAVVCAGLALARPQWGFVMEEARQRGLDIVVAIDTSRSMLADDLRPNRLERAKLAALDVMRVAHSDRLALVPFAGTAFLQCPLTLDQEAFRQNVQALGVGIMPQGGTALAEAIRVSHAAFEKGTDNTKVMLLLTDGEDHEEGALEAARKAAGEGLRIFTLGVGTSEGEVLRELDEQGGTTYVRDAQGEVVKSRLNEGLLRQLAAEAGGFYLPLQASAAVETLYEQGLSGLTKSDLASREYRRYHERFQWPLGLAMILLIVELFLPGRIGKQRRAVPGAASPIAGTVAVVLAMSMPTGLQGASPGRAQREYERGRYEQSREAYDKLLKRRPDDPRLLYNAGTAAYRAQDYTNAIEVLGKATTAADLALQQRAFFNLGDALYRQGEQVPDRQSREDLWRQAVQNFEAALKLNPQDQDAEFNRQLVEQKIEELKQQEPEEGEQGEGEEQEQQEEQGDQKEQRDQGDQKDQGAEKDQPDQGEGSEEPEPSEGSEQQEQPQQPQEQQEQPGSQPAPGAEGDEGKPESRPMPRPEGMTEQEAGQMLDAFREEERPLIYQPTEQELKRRGRVFKDW